MIEQRALRVLIIDHYDSYTNNLLQLLPASGEQGSAEVPAWDPVIVRYDDYEWSDFTNEVLPQFDAVILSPGPGRPDSEVDFGFNSRLIREADVPILGICLGHQGIGTSFGAKILHAPHIKHGQVSQIQHDGAGLFRGLQQDFGGVQYNSLTLDPDSLPQDLIATAWTKDHVEPSIRLLLGIKHKSKPIYGVQWHPESICSTFGVEIFNNFRSIVLEFWDSHLERSQRYWERYGRLGLDVDSASINHCSTNTEVEASLPSLYPAYKVEMVDIESELLPERVFEQCVRNPLHDGEVWLDSAKSRDEHSRYSYLANSALTVHYCTRTKMVTIRQGHEVMKTQLVDSFWTWFDNVQQAVKSSVQALRPDVVDDSVQNGKASLQIGFIGYFGYEMKRESLPGYQWCSTHDQVEGEQPDAQFMFAQEVLRYDHRNKSWKLFGLIRNEDSDPLASILGINRVGSTEQQFHSRTKWLRANMKGNRCCKTGKDPLPKFTGDHNQRAYSSKIDRAREAIREGDSYEMTLTTKFRASCKRRDYGHLYRTLRANNPAPYSAFMNFAATDTTIMSSSPERFISIDSQGFAEMKPIKGTVAVNKDPSKDAAIRQKLATDVKELAENLMIVDLIRNDLHRISPSDSIKVPKLMQVESYETVHQLVTTIQSRIRSSVGSIQAVKDIFPPGSMTGAPKLRSVQILDDLEDGQERGVYSGCLGYICASGAVDQSVVIRTIVRQGDDLELGAGGAITWLSHPDREWEEVLIKANAVAEIDTSQSRADSLEPVLGQ